MSERCPTCGGHVKSVFDHVDRDCETERWALEINLTERDLDTLNELEAACRSYLRMEGHDWVRPMDCGGSNSSHHSATLSKLVRKGLAERRRQSSGARGSWRYRISPAGRLRIEDYHNGR